jgi:hypothetical protein
MWSILPGAIERGSGESSDERFWTVLDFGIASNAIG